MRLIKLIPLMLLSMTIKVGAAATDAEILDVVKTANNAEIAAAEVANTKASNPKVREFAATMIQEHKKNNSDMESVVQKSSVTPTSNVTSQAMKSDADLKLAELEKAPSTSNAFDKLYIEQQISMHKALITELKDNLIPKASNKEVKDYLIKTRKHVESHFAKANQIQQQL